MKINEVIIKLITPKKSIMKNNKKYIHDIYEILLNNSQKKLVRKTISVGCYTVKHFLNKLKNVLNGSKLYNYF